MPRRRGPATLLCREGIEIKGRVSSIDASAPTRYFQWGLRGLVVADGDEIAEDLVADVSPLLEYFLGRRPILVTDLASAENIAAAPTSFDVLDAFEQLGGLGTAVFFADGCYQRLSVAGDITPTATLSMAEHGEKAAREIDYLQIVLVRFFQDRQIAVFRRKAEHAGQGWNPDRT